MSDREMTLRMRIRAQGEEARKAFKQLNADLVALQNRVTSTGKVISETFSGLGQVTSAAFTPLRFVGKAFGVVAGGAMAMGMASLYAAAGQEKLQSRLAAVAGSAAAGARAMETIEKMSRHSGFKTEDLAEAAIVMKQYGVTSQRSLRAIAAAAKVAGMDVGTLAFQTMALQSRGLKHFGIELDDTKTNPVIKWRDKMGQIQTITAKTADEARQKLVEVFAMKFGTDIAPKGLLGMIQMFKNNLEQASEQFGQGLLEPAKRFIDYITGGLSSAIESGKLEEWGKKAGEWLNQAVTKVMAFVDTMKSVFSELPKLISGAGDGLRDVITAVVGGIGKTLGVAVVEYLMASAKVFVALGKLIGSALKESFLSLDLPGTRGVRENGVRRALSQMTEADAIAAGINPDFAGNVSRMESPERADLRNRDISHFIKTLPPDKAAHLASFDSGANMISAIQSISADIRVAAENVKLAAINNMAGVGSAFKGATGFDFARNFTQNAASRSLEADHSGYVTARFMALEAPDKERPWYRRNASRDVTRHVENIDDYSLGGKTPSGGIIIRIDKLDVNTNDAGRVTKEIIDQALRSSSLQFAG